MFTVIFELQPNAKISKYNISFLQQNLELIEQLFLLFAVFLSLYFVQNGEKIFLHVGAGYLSHIDGHTENGQKSDHFLIAFPLAMLDLGEFAQQRQLLLEQLQLRRLFDFTSFFFRLAAECKHLISVSDDFSIDRIKLGILDESILNLVGLTHDRRESPGQQAPRTAALGAIIFGADGDLGPEHQHVGQQEVWLQSVLHLRDGLEDEGQVDIGVHGQLFRGQLRVRGELGGQLGASHHCAENYYQQVLLCYAGQWGAHQLLNRIGGWITSQDGLQIEMLYYIDYVIAMDEELKTRDSQRSYTAEDQDEMNWSESSQTYYYSKFQLFEGNQEINQFYRYSVFLEQLSEELGEEWRAEAYVLFHPHFTSQDVFMNLLNVWLQLHPAVNTLHLNPLAKHPSPVFNNTFIDDFVARMKRIHAQTPTGHIIKPQLRINTTSIKTVCMGFFITANEIWTEMFRVEDKNANKGFSLFKGVTKKIQESFEPLMVVTEKISNLFGRKKVKIDQSYSHSPVNDGIFGDCYIEFRRTIGIEKELQRKMSQFCLEDEPEHENQSQKKKIIKDEFKESDSPLEKSALSNIYSYVTKFLNKKYPWQVASSFVTNILDINQQKMEDGTRIKVLKPAEDFYQKLIIGWLMLRKCKEEKTDITFEEYLNHMKVSFGRAWRQNYILPTKYFYERLIKHWHDIQREVLLVKLSQKEILHSLINKIRESMREDWQRKIKIDKKKAHDRR